MKTPRGDRDIEQILQGYADRIAALESKAALANQDGSLLSLGALAFGANASKTDAQFDFASGGTTFHVDGAEATLAVTVATGRLLVAVSAVIFSSLSGSNVIMSWNLLGPTPSAADQFRGLVVPTSGFAAAAYSSNTFYYLHDGLAAGDYTIQAAYRCDPYGPSDTGSANHRTIVATPY